MTDLLMYAMGIIALLPSLVFRRFYKYMHAPRDVLSQHETGPLYFIHLFGPMILAIATYIWLREGWEPLATFAEEHGGVIFLFLGILTPIFALLFLPIIEWFLIKTNPKYGIWKKEMKASRSN